MFNIKIHKNFIKSFEKIDDDYKNNIFDFLEKLKNTNDLLKINGVKKLSGSKGFYRFRIGDYRIGFFVNKDNIDILVLKSRGDFYKTFPKNYL
ncbi:type II toxin-antitoxin system RelE/ParE family toxin [Candidatus Gracilibacteria bacterium]|nr:type II toxin-antitoxin system RelE/ParE family toxin [Candidatus Gracilibacteria bacterium]